MDFASVEVNLPIHHHPMTPLKDSRRGDCCGIKFEAMTDGYYCNKCDYFYHMSCSNASTEINHYSHRCRESFFLTNHIHSMRCCLCGEKVQSDVKAYECRGHMYIVIHLECLKYPPAKVIDVTRDHDHKLTLEPLESYFKCATCGEEGDGFSYKCRECDLTFHVNCKKYAAEVNHPSHSLHSLKYFCGEPPAYTHGKCSLCGEKVGEAFYHCSTCNFTLDLGCASDPPPLHVHDVDTHDHKLTLMPKLFSFTCTTCGLNGDRSPYVCLQCTFTSHNDCFGFPWVININRHNHRVSRTSLLGVVNSVCGVCQKKMDWSCGGYSCKRCPSFVFHAKCATREDVSDGIEMKYARDGDEDIKPFQVIDENTIFHSLHYFHDLRLDTSGIFVKERSCEACAYPIYHHSFYGCMSCKFLIHVSCANLPIRKRHVVSNKLYILNNPQGYFSQCEACGVIYNGFKYGLQEGGLDMRCASVTEPFFHRSHPHPLFYTSPRGVCGVCNKKAHHVLRCVEDDCGYVMDFKCAFLPYEVKHRVDPHFLSLCFGEDGKKTSGKYWCDICEKETDPQSWFYTCKDCGVTLHIDCVLGDTRGLRPGSDLAHYRKSRYFEVVHNNSMTRPHCNKCKSRCVIPVILKQLKKSGNVYYCSIYCSNVS